MRVYKCALDAKYQSRIITRAEMRWDKEDNLIFVQVPLFQWLKDAEEYRVKGTHERRFQ
jgi:hypothetical protein